MNILERLEQEFPECWFKPGQDFDSGSALVWSGEGSYVSEIGDDLQESAFDILNMDYEFGVHPVLAEFAADLGCHWEAVDSGTFLLYED